MRVISLAIAPLLFFQPSNSFPSAPKETRACDLWYSVRINDTCYDIAKTLGIELKLLQSLNPGISYTLIYPNQTLCVFSSSRATSHHSKQAPISQASLQLKTKVQTHLFELTRQLSAVAKCSPSYQIEDGDSCLGVAQAFNTTVANLQDLNHGLDCLGAYLEIGKVLCL
ncbi:hypothetical protein HDU78_001797 [Chytriomyces hyalinus]|nr:hypothetical protein HDU78_001797 [Chytriomyces hyalinus]